MSDFFMPNQFLNPGTQPQTDNGFWDKQVQQVQEQNQKRLENRKRFGIELNDEEYEQINNLIADSDNYDEEAHKIGTALLYSKQLNIPLAEAYTNLDAYNEALWGADKPTNYRSAFTAVADMLAIGNNGCKLGTLGNELRKAEHDNDQELIDLLMAEIAAIESDNTLRQDNAPRSWVTEALKCGAQLLPFSAEAAGLGFFGNFIVPGLGTALAFGSSSSMAAGQEYIDMRREGVSKETAAKVASISGGVQGLLEVALGTTTSYLAAGAGKAVTKTATGQLAQKAAENFAKRFHYGPGKKVAVNLITQWSADKLGESLEEVVQEITSIVADDVARSLDGLNLDDKTISDTVNRVTDAFKGGIVGAIVLGLPFDMANTKAQVKDYQKVRNLAEKIDSEEEFKKAVKDNPVFKGFKDNKKDELIYEVWNNVQSEREAQEMQDVKARAEANSADESFEDIQTDEETGETNADAVARDELSGSLISQDDVVTEENGIQNRSYRVGDNSKAEKNNYGYIDYSLNESDKTVTINDFKMSQARESLRGEMFDDFAQKYAGYDIQWNPKLSVAKDIKADLIANNPSGSINGLNYYNDQATIKDTQTRKKLAGQIRSAYKSVGKELSNEQITADIYVLESAYKRLKSGLNEAGADIKSFTDYINYTFGDDVFGDSKAVVAAAINQGVIPDNVQGASVTRTLNEFNRGMKALVYVTEKGDFSTFSHEIAHIARKQLTGDLLATAEKAYDVQDHNWTREQEEKFAYGFEQFLREGKAENEALRNLFTKIAQFLMDCFNAFKTLVNLNPDIESVYNELLSADNSVLRAAQKATEEQERELKAALDEQATHKARAEREKLQAEKEAQRAEREAMSEITLFDEEENAQTIANEEDNLQGQESKETVVNSERIENAVNNTSLNETEKAQAIEILNNDESALQEKQSTASDVAGSVYEDEEIPDLLYQLAGVPSIRRMAESAEKERILADLDAAILLDGRYKSMDAKSKASRIRMMTGWEKDATGAWKYELDDSINRIKGGTKFAEILKNNPELLAKASQSSLLNLGDILDAPELYKVFPYMKSVRVSFYSDPNAFRAVLTPQGIKVNTRYLQGVDGEKGLKGVLAHEIQHVIQAMEYAESKGLQGTDIEQLYNDMMKAMQAAGERKYDYDLTSLQNGLDAYMQDAGEIEARNVARRIMMNADQRRMNTLASTEDVKRQELLFQAMKNQAEQTEAERQMEAVRKQYEGTDTWMKAPNGQPTNLTEKQWLQVRTPNFKRWFGNWELEQKEFSIVDVDQAEFNNKAAAMDWAEKNITGLMTNDETGGKGEINISNKSVDEMLNLNQRGKSSSNEVHYAALTKLREIIHDSEIVDAHPDFGKDENGKRTPLAGINKDVNIDVLYGALRFKGEIYRVKTTIKRFIDKNAKAKAYAYDVQKIEVLPGIADNSNNATVSKGNTSITGNILLRGIRKVNQKTGGDGELALDDYSKVLDENGEPLVVYHGSSQWFQVFNEGKTNKASNVNTPDNTIFTNDNKEIASSFQNYYGGKVTDVILDENSPLHRKNDWGTYRAGGVYSLFMNLRNPKIVDYKGQTWKADGMNINDEVAKAMQKGYDGFIAKNIIDVGFTDVTPPASNDYIAFNNTDVKSATDNNGNFDANNPNLLFQTVYHGSGADFDKFDTENFGLSGEKSMSFGYGVYLTDSEDIAKEYARRQAHQKYPEKDRNLDAIANYMLGHKISFDEAKQIALDTSLRFAEGYEKEKIRKQIEGLKESDLEFIGKGKVYTVEIPDDGYLEWDRLYKNEEIPAIAKALRTEIEKDYSYGDAYIEWDYLEELENHAYTMSGANLLNNIKSIFYGNEKEKKASKYLNRIGYAGIKYPAGTIHGNGNGAYNYVIFNDDDAQIVDKLLFQTQAELYADARSYDTWEAFMNAYTLDFDPVALEDPMYHSQVPADADAQWYQTTWELAHGIQPEESMNIQEVLERDEAEGSEPKAMDALFSAELKNNPLEFDDFMHMVAYYAKIDLNSPEWNNITNADEAAEREQIERLQDLITVVMHSESMTRAINKIAAGGEIIPSFRNKLIAEMTDTFKVRDFRQLYAEVMDRPTYKVNPQDTTESILNEKMDNVKRRYNLELPAVDVSRLSPQQRKELSDKVDSEEIAAKLRDGTLKMDDQVDKYIKALKSQISDLKEQQKELNKAILDETERLADEEQKDLLKLHDDLLRAKLAYDKKNDEITRRISKGLKITRKYESQSQNLKHDYNEILRKYKDALATAKITGEVQRALDTQDRLSTALSNIDKLESERVNMGEVQKLRKNLVKRTMRRVKFDTVDYEHARQIIAIQRLFEPNLIGGVNKWIGQTEPYLRGIISAVVTDKDYRNELTNYLRRFAKSSGAYSEFMKKWNELITAPTVEAAMKKFNSWDDKTRKRASLYLPKEDWVKELELMELDKEREESIDLDIGIKERRVPMRDEKGELIYKPQYDEKGKLIKNPDTQEMYFKTIYEFDASDEIKAMVKDAVGEDIYQNLLYRPFSEWTVEEMENLAKRVDDLYTEGRDILVAKKQLQNERAAKIRKVIQETVNNTGIVINDDDTPEEKLKKQEKIDKILGLNTELKGTVAAQDKGFKARMNRLLHGYNDANVLRVARILDGNDEGANVNELYRKEDDCYNTKTRSINSRVEKINQVLKNNNITLEELAQSIDVDGHSYTIDELLFFAAANEDYQDNERILAKPNAPKPGSLEANDDFAATSRNAVMFGNLLSDTENTELKASLDEEDKVMQQRIENDELTTEEKQDMAQGLLDKTPGTTKYIMYCHKRMESVLQAVSKLDPKFKALQKVIADDYAEQYERMNKISIEEFNSPVHRVKCYVPLVRLESNGDTNVNQVKEDLLAAMGQGAAKQWVNRGMTQRRVNMRPLNQKPVQTGLYKTWADSVDRTEHFIAYAGYVRELNRIYKSRDAQYMRQFIENRFGKGMLQYLDDYINEVANPNANKIREKGAELLHTLRGKTAPAYLAWKASAIVKQGLTSPWPYMQFINPAEYLAAAWKCVTSKGSLYDAIREKSAFMKNRVMDPMNDLIDEMAEKTNQNKFSRALNKFNKKGMSGLEWIDWVSVAPGWYACYEKKYNELVGNNQEVYEATKLRLQEENAMAEFGTPAWKTPEQIEQLAQKAMKDDVELKAIQFADDCTRQVQPSNRSVDIAPLFKNSSEAMKAYLQFQTSLNVIWQNIRYDLPYAVKKEQFSRIVGTILGYTLAGIFMNSVMSGLGGDEDDDGSKADDRLKNLIFYATTQFTDAVPMLGSELTNTMDKIITGKSSYMSTGTDMTPTATKFFAILTNAKKGNWEKAADMTAEGIAMYLGLPVSGAKEIKKIAGIGDGDGKAQLDLGNVYGILDKDK